MIKLEDYITKKFAINLLFLVTCLAVCANVLAGIMEIPNELALGLTFIALTLFCFYSYGKSMKGVEILEKHKKLIGIYQEQRARLETLTEANNSLGVDNEALMQENKSLEEKADTLRRGLKACDAERQTLNKNMEAYRALLKSYQSLKETHQAQSEKLMQYKEAATKIEVQRDDFYEKYRSKAAEVSALKKKIGKMLEGQLN